MWAVCVSTARLVRRDSRHGRLFAVLSSMDDAKALFTFNIGDMTEA